MEGQRFSSKYICIDVGGTAIKYGILCGNESFFKKGSVETPPNGRAILARVSQIIEAELNDYKADGEMSLPVGVCISSTGMINPEDGSVFYSGPAIQDFVGIQYKKTIEERFCLPCEAENDVNCVGLAECHAGAAKGHECALILTIGTGIGGCAVINGKVHHGVTNSACEVGYLDFGKGFFQDLASTSSLVKKVEAAKEAKSPWNGKRVFEEAKNGDEICIKAIDEMCDVLGLGISNLCFVLNPSIVVLGGGVMAQEELLLPKIRHVMDSYLPSLISKNTLLAAAQYHNDAGMLGAYYHFLSMQKNREKV